jgi:hypothetical protein
MTRRQHSSAPNGTARELTPRQTVTLTHLLTGVGVEEAAKLAGVGERTVWTWLRESPPFRRELRARQRQAMEDATAELQALASQAVKALGRVLNDSAAPHGAVVSAAKAVLEAGARGIELGEVAERVDALEQQMAAAPEPGSSLRRH